MRDSRYLTITIISTGLELITGRSVETNAGFLAKFLTENGFKVRKICILGDDPKEIAEELQNSTDCSGFVIITGGLGPTADDRTRLAIAEAAGVGLVKNYEALQNVTAVLESRGREVSKRHMAQTLTPGKVQIFKNETGTACGFCRKIGKAKVIAMPGVPDEMRTMFLNRVWPFIKEDLRKSGTGGEVVANQRVNVFGLPESGVNSLIDDMMATGRNPQLGLCVRANHVIISVNAKAATQQEAEHLVESDVSELHSRLGDAVYGLGDETLAGSIFSLLKRNGLRIAVAESCTGGMVGSLMVDVPGISDFFLLDIVAYGNEAKKELLGVSENCLKTHGAVSEEVAESMAEGICRISGAETGISVTGIAGPSGAGPSKPVGLVYLGINICGRISCYRHNLNGNRNLIREKAAGLALNHLRLGLLRL